MSKDASALVCRVIASGAVTGYCQPLLTKLEEEVWSCKLFIRGYIPFDIVSSTGQILLEITGFCNQVEVLLDFVVTKNI